MNKKSTPLLCPSKQAYVSPRLAVYALHHSCPLMDQSQQIMSVQKKGTDDPATYNVGW